MTSEVPYTIRRYRPADSSACGAIYVDAVRNGTAPHYSAEQAAAWVPDGAEHWDWAPRLTSGQTWIAEVKGIPSGFITLRSDGHLDLFFVRPDVRHLGIAGALYEQLVEDARRSGLTRLTTHASLLARRFLERRGWRVAESETAERHGVSLTRYYMLRDLPFD